MESTQGIWNISIGKGDRVYIRSTDASKTPNPQSLCESNGLLLYGYEHLKDLAVAILQLEKQIVDSESILGILGETSSPQQCLVMFKFDDDDAAPLCTIGVGDEFIIKLKKGYIKFEKSGKSFQLFIEPENCSHTVKEDCLNQDNLTELQINQLGWKFVKRYDHDQYHTARYSLGCIEIEFTYEGTELLTHYLNVTEQDSISISFNQAKTLTELLKQWNDPTVQAMDGFAFGRT